MMNLAKVVPYTLIEQKQPSLLMSDFLLIELILLPVSLIGVWLGYRLHLKISEANFMLACKGLLFFSGLGLLASAY